MSEDKRVQEPSLLTVALGVKNDGQYPTDRSRRSQSAVQAGFASCEFWEWVVRFPEHVDIYLTQPLA